MFLLWDWCPFTFLGNALLHCQRVLVHCQVKDSRAEWSSLLLDTGELTSALSASCSISSIPGTTTSKACFSRYYLEKLGQVD